MKIAMIIISDGWGGAEKAVHSISLELIKKSIDVEIILNNEIKKFYEDIKGVKIIDLGKRISNKSFENIMNIIKIRKELKKRIKEKNYDIIQINLEGSFLLLYKNVPKIKSNLITVLHGVEIENYRNKSFNNILDNLSLREIMNKSKKIIINRNYDLEEFNIKKKIIPNGVDTKIFKPKKNFQNKKIILFVGHYIYLKGIKEILKIAKLLPQYEFWFVGEGNLKNKIKGANIKNLGFKSEKDLIKIYNDSTICTFPSHYEGFGLVGLEAMACGKPVIATPLGFSEYIENGKDGIIIPAKDENALKEAIVKLMENPKLREKLGKAARKKAEQYSWDKIVKRYISIYKEINRK